MNESIDGVQLWVRWLIATLGRCGAGSPSTAASAPVLARISQAVQAALVVVIVFAATALARGFFF